MINKWLCTAVAVLGSAAGLTGAAWADEGAARDLRFYGDVVNIDITAFLKPGKNELVLVTRGWKVDYPPPELHIK